MTRLSESLAKFFLRLNLIGLCEQNHGKPICQAFNLRVNLRERLCKWAFKLLKFLSSILVTILNHVRQEIHAGE